MALCHINFSSISCCDSPILYQESTSLIALDLSHGHCCRGNNVGCYLSITNQSFSQQSVLSTPTTRWMSANLTWCVQSGSTAPSATCETAPGCLAPSTDTDTSYEERKEHGCSIYVLEIAILPSLSSQTKPWPSHRSQAQPEQCKGVQRSTNTRWHCQELIHRLNRSLTCLLKVSMVTGTGAQYLSRFVSELCWI